MQTALLAFDTAFMWQTLPEILQAAGVTIQISCLAMLLGTSVGFLLGGLRVLGPSVIKSMIQGWVDFVRGVPPLLIIAFIYFALPSFGLRLNEFWTGVIALTIIAAGYQVEIVRAAIESVDRGQREAALAIGMDEPMVLMQILFPQAAKRMIPALTNELANVVKASSLLSVISVNELTKVGNALIFENFVFAEILIQVAVLYLIIVGVLTKISSYLENKVFSFNASQPLARKTSAMHQIIR
ncbi:amino acid ABC transporter permease [Phormidium tenue FACHB-886]|nr:amino acid ABC transporter permease [Phormidium tenue FACHB-886]